jgi:phenylacetate-CoA ligase
MFLRAAAELYRLKRNEWLTPQELERRQWRKLKRMLRHAYENVPYYHRLFSDAGITPEDIKSREDVAKIPVTTKTQIQALPPEEIMAKGYSKEKCLEFRTSGSTGRPLNVYRTQREKEFFDIVWLRCFLGAGLKWRDKKVSICILPPVPEPRKFWFQSFGIMRREYIPFFKNEESAVEFLKKEDFDVLISFPSRFRIFTQRIKREGRSGRGPRLVFSAAEMLDPRARRQIEETFQAPVFDFYGMVEFRAMAWECASHHGFHINADTVLLEVVRNGMPVKAGERGRIIATGLHSYAMPFVRYDTEDVGSLSTAPCPCGRSLPLLERLEGRCNDLITLSNGKVLTPGFVFFLRGLEGIRQYRVVQERVDELIVCLALEANAPSDLVQRVENGIKAGIGEPVTIRMKIVDEIPPDRFGKLRVVISYVPVNF